MNEISYKDKNGAMIVLNENRLKLDGILINIRGENNKISFDSSVNFLNSSINITACDCRVTIKKSKYDWPVICNIAIKHGNEQIVEIGEDFTSDGTLIEMLQPKGRLVIGDDCMFSQNIIIQGGDGHCVFTNEEKPKLINFSQNGIEIGNHVWIRRNVTVTENTRIPSNCVVEISSLINSKLEQENSYIVGVPGEAVNKGIFWERKSIKNYMEEQEQRENSNIVIAGMRRINMHEFVDNRFHIVCLGKDNMIEIGENVKTRQNGRIYIRIEGNHNFIQIGKNVNVHRNLFIGISKGAPDVYADSCKCIIGDGCIFNGKDTELICGEEGTEISVGEDCLFAQNIQIITTDNHCIYDTDTEKRINGPESIKIGNHVWIGRDVLVLKGAEVADNSIIGARTLLNKKFKEENILIAGNPGKIKKNKVNWSNFTQI